jgi:putative addiction module component (TIGR02574 family)
MLKPKERARLAEVMLESIRTPSSSDIPEAWEAEIMERVAAYDQRKLQTYSAKDVFSEANKYQIPEK